MLGRTSGLVTQFRPYIKPPQTSLSLSDHLRNSKISTNLSSQGLISLQPHFKFRPSHNHHLLRKAPKRQSSTRGRMSSQNSTNGEKPTSFVNGTTANLTQLSGLPNAFKSNPASTSSTKAPKPFNYRKAASARPFAEALRAQATARTQAAAVKPVSQPVRSMQPPPPTRCADSDCSVTAWHSDKEFRPGDADLPSIIKTVDMNWYQNVVRGNVYGNGDNKTLLHRFYISHGMNEDDFNAFYTAPPEKCQVASCPVTQAHPAENYEEGDDDLPLIVKRNIATKNEAWYAYDEGLFQAKRRWVNRFLKAHSADKSAETPASGKETSDEGSRSWRNWSESEGHWRQQPIGLKEGQGITWMVISINTPGTSDVVVWSAYCQWISSQYHNCIWYARDNT